MRISSVIALVAFASSCGGRENIALFTVDSGSATATHDGAAAADDAATEETTLGTGPLDASGLPSELVLPCTGSATAITLTLPCLLGLNFAGPRDEPGFHVLECRTSDAPRPALGLIVPLALLPGLLNQPIQLPFEGLPDAPSYSFGIRGTAIFSQVDPVGRSFVGRLQNAEVDGKDNDGSSVTCNVTDQPFWAAPGGFL